MATSILINASEAAATVIGFIPVLIGILIIGAVLYAVAIWVFLEKKSPLWRLFGFVIAALFAFIGIEPIMKPGNEWGIINLVFLAPMLFGVVAEYLLRKKQRTA
ncbi:hypothetical protein [Hymenobacter sp. UYCo722]|uniref:hypothetical protein n=1 Tax=Hymenobacter sp. UYCo722 TaxID=3156335 RepID=UPI003398E4D5